MAGQYPWYDLVDGSELAQGDLVPECPVVVPASQISDETRARVVYYDIVIMSQSCDLAHGKIDLVLVCPVWPLAEVERRSDFFRSRNGKESLRQGNVPGYHLLDRCQVPGFESDYLVVDFRNVYGVPFPFLLELTQTRGQRVRLLPPYREHLSQAFARFFMRVGLPVDIPPFR